MLVEHGPRANWENPMDASDPAFWRAGAISVWTTCRAAAGVGGWKTPAEV